MISDETAGRPDGIDGFEGEAAVAEGVRERRAMARGDAPDPLEGLSERIKAEGRTELALDRLVIDALLDLEEIDGPGFGEQCRLLRTAGVLSKDLDPALKRRRKQRAEDAKREEQERARQRAAQQRREAEAALAEAREAEEAARAELAAQNPTLALHTGDYHNASGAIYSKQPGRMRLRVPTKNDFEVTELSNFSAVIVANLLDFDTPEAKPRMAFLLSVIFEGREEAFEIEVPAKDFARMEWVELLIRGAAVAPGKVAREHLRYAIQRMSNAVTRKRYRFIGWVEDEGQMIYIHAGGAIGAEGEVPGVVASLSDPIDRFRLSLPENREQAYEDALAQVELFSMEPADVIVPLMGTTFRAPLGPSRLTAHLAGEQEVGKTYLMGLFQMNFGPKMGEELPASWVDGSSANGISRVYARAGDALVVSDDLRVTGGPKDVKLMDIYDQVTRAHYNRAAPRKLTREGGERNDPPSRCTAITTGEVLPQGHSTRSRVVCLMLSVRSTPDASDLARRGAEGVLARGMGGFVRWLAPSAKRTRDRISVAERAAADRWRLGVSDRAAGLFGAIALGLDALFKYWLDVRAQTPEEVAAHRARAEVALRRVAIEHGERVKEEDPVPKFVQMLRTLLASGKAYLSTPQGTAPIDCHLYGWRASSSFKPTDGPDGEERGPNFAPYGLRLGFVRTSEGRMWIMLDVAYGLVRDMARANGDTFGVAREDLPKRLHQRGLLAADELKSRQTYTTRLRVEGARNPTSGLLCFEIATILGAEEKGESVSGVSEGVQGVSGTPDTEEPDYFR